MSTTGDEVTGGATGELGKYMKDAFNSCSFCGKGQQEVRKLVAGPEVMICNECVDKSVELINEQEQTEVIAERSARSGLPTPREIKAHLDEYVIAQDDAKRKLAVAVYNHYKRINHNGLPLGFDDLTIGKSNILLAGPTGSGKTWLLQNLARHLNVPFVIADATSLTEAGYVGEDVQGILQRLLAECDSDVGKAQKGIVYIDEIDKIAAKESGGSSTRDVGGEGVQQALLKMVEGSVVKVPQGRQMGQETFVAVDTRDILFICGGAFTGLEGHIRARLAVADDRPKIGFGAAAAKKETPLSTAEVLKQAEPQDFIKCGIIPEFVGRLPVITATEELDETALVRVLTEPKNSLVKEFGKLIAMDGSRLTVTEDACHAIAKKARARKTGARGLRTIVEGVLTDVMFDLPSQPDVREVVIDGEVIEGKAKPKLVHVNDNDKGPEMGEPKMVCRAHEFAPRMG